MIRPDGDGRIPIRDGADTDHDGHPDTMELPVRDELALAVDVDRDNLADLLVRIGADGLATTVDLGADPDPWLATDAMADACYDPSRDDWP
jgi:hypothetical protein